MFIRIIVEDHYRRSMKKRGKKINAKWRRRTEGKQEMRGGNERGKRTWKQGRRQEVR